VGIRIGFGLRPTLLLLHGSDDTTRFQVRKFMTTDHCWRSTLDNLSPWSSQKKLT